MKPRARAWIVLGGSLAAHLVAVQLIPSPWLVPNLTLVGVVAGVAAAPQHWLGLGGAAGLLSMLWAPSQGWSVAAGYIAVGAFARLATRHWDASDPRVGAIIMAIGSGAVTAGWVTLLPARPWALLGLAALHIALTTGAGWIVSMGAAWSDGS